MEVQGNKPVGVPLGHYFAIAAAYAACYEVVRHFSFSHWMLTAGLRLACLLLVPRRYWAALLVGEALPVVENAIICAPVLGTPWALVSSLPFIAFCMPVVSAIRRRMTLHDAEGNLRMSTILIVTLACALVTAVRTNLAVYLAFAVQPTGMAAWKAEAVPDLLASFLGNYLGALTLTPVLLALHQVIRDRGANLRSLISCPLIRETACLTAPVLVALVIVARSGGPMAQELTRLGIVTMVLIATCRHGWHGGALAGMFGSIAMATTATIDPALLDSAMIRAQAILALAISGALIAGVRIARRATRRAGSY